jgi:hypothetical protein
LALLFLAVGLYSILLVIPSAARDLQFPDGSRSFDSGCALAQDDNCFSRRLKVLRLGLRPAQDDIAFPDGSRPFDSGCALAQDDNCFS